MASITITVPDSTVSRILAAFGVTDPMTNITTPAVVADVQAAIKNYVRGRVVSYETQRASFAQQATSETDVLTW